MSKVSKVDVALWAAPILFFTLFMVNFSYGLENSKEPLKVVIFDTGILDIGYKHKCKDGHKSFSNDKSIKDSNPNRHGSNVTAIIERTAGPGNWCFIIVKYSDTTETDMTQYLAAFEYASTLSPYLINLSVAGRTYSFKEDVYMKKLLKAGTIVVAAAGNDGDYIPEKNCNVYPACLDPAIHVIGNSGSKSSNRGPFVDAYINGEKVQGAGVALSGTSQSAAIYSGRLIKDALKGL